MGDHINLMCEKCGKIIDYKPSESAVREQIEQLTGFLVTDSRLEFYGLCRNCASGLKEGEDNAEGRLKSGKVSIK